MIIETITFMYNEQFLAPLFLKHYEDIADKITIVLDTDSTDNTEAIIRKHPKVNIFEYTFPDGMDDQKKVDLINLLYSSSTADVVLNVDADEFIFTHRKSIEKKLEEHPIYACRFAHVYRHESEKDINISDPIKLQRRHGYYDPMYNKPIILKTKLPVKWLAGNHVLITNNNIINDKFGGSHLANADTCFCVERRVKNRRDRQSKYNLENRLTVQHHNITEEDVLKECEAHKQDAQLW